MRNVIFLLIIGSGILFAGVPKNVYFHIVDQNGDQFNFNDGNDNVYFEMWNPEREDEILTCESEGSSYEMFGGVWSGIICNVGYFPTPWLPGDKIKLKVKHFCDKGWYEPASGAVIYTLYLPDDGVSPMFFGFEPLIEGTGEPIVLDAYKYDESDIEYNIPSQIALEQNYPNPFNPSTTIRFSLSERDHVSLNIYNMNGERVSTLVDSELSAGYHTLDFNGSELSTGVYYYILEARGQASIKIMLLLK